jgi:opacity protein-like surface antigen
MRMRALLATVVAMLALSVASSTAVAAPDAYGCQDNYFCLYDGNNWTGASIQFGPGYTGAGWQFLPQWGWGLRVNSVRNRRDLDSLLSTNEPGGTRFCSDSHSSDANLSNNAIGNNNAIHVANVPDNIHC